MVYLALTINCNKTIETEETENSSQPNYHRAVEHFRGEYLMETSLIANEKSINIICRRKWNWAIQKHRHTHKQRFAFQTVSFVVAVDFAGSLLLSFDIINLMHGTVFLLLLLIFFNFNAQQIHFFERCEPNETRWRAHRISLTHTHKHTPETREKKNSCHTPLYCWLVVSIEDNRVVWCT